MPIVFDFKAIKNRLDQLDGIKPSGRAFDENGKEKQAATKRDEEWSSFWKVWNFHHLSDTHVRTGVGTWEPKGIQKVNADAIEITFENPLGTKFKVEREDIAEPCALPLILNPIGPHAAEHLAHGQQLDMLAAAWGLQPRQYMEPDDFFRTRLISERRSAR